MAPKSTSDDHWLIGARRCVSPNFNDRPAQTSISLLVIHNISLPPGEFGGADIERLFTNSLDTRAHPFYAELEGLEVSAHAYIRRDGELVQFVPLNRRAWHAGQSFFEGRENCNDFSIGIELEGADDIPYTQAQYDVLATLTRTLMQAYPDILPRRIVGHSDIAPERKTDPGPAFDWAYYKSLIGA
ncbi:1,6-anhydro-N-acetylmuramyl-L-alanine amidase AmpD [Simiduia sp. 21SJ11W-1]|uniref:1,6-anhydro-N-acetylmuramyl-L-alanine amidase AmpD n=1 Tax=Simiduia sp. 21SJ11W-1 TaxID=2909669 RepID=UPI00209D5EA0|nr:1,6-anhydro-N-acetylmuramyl-L-alanine amidase AmpD [Simiduia sp. 21SJ11W-1]UTA48891.1 1,6-anhydro-N-acetylmuramyl-L-alanine amidase AmpD [Simiduia sp. 21SJ11W-1]